jgi:SnoaL-like domain
MTHARQTNSWSVDSWCTFWANPSAERALVRAPTVITDDVVGVWPHATRPVRGKQEYTQRIVALLSLVPDLHLDLMEHATNGEFVFLRWSGRGTGPDGVFQAFGVDRVRLRDGLVAENLILSDHPIFAVLAKRAEAEVV